MTLNFKKSPLLLILFLFQFSSAINVRFIKDTYTILKPEFKQLSPTHGPVWWEKNIAKNMYKFNGDVLTKFLFYVPQQGEGAGVQQVEDFVLTKSEFSPATYFAPRTVGRLLGAVERSRIAIARAQAKIAAIQQKKAPQKGQLSAKQIASNKEVAGLASNLEKELSNVFSSDIAYQQQVADYIKSLPDEEKKVAQGKINTALKKMIKALLGSLENSGFFDLVGNSAKALYPPYQTYDILLAFLFRKAQDVRGGNNVGKADFKEYFDGLRELLGDVIFTPEGQNLLQSNAWLLDAYDVSSALYRDQIRVEVDRLQGLDLKILDQVYEKMVYIELSRPQGFPKRAAYRSDSLFQGQTFTDCMDTTLRNMANTVVFDSSSNTFDLEKLPEGAVPSEEAITFYRNFNHTSDVENPLVHTAWNAAIQNRLYVAYERIVDLGNAQKKAKLSDQAHGLKGFMLATKELQGLAHETTDITFKDGTVQEFDIAEVQGAKFVLIPNQYVVYELQPTLRNVIVLMNELFGLRLYQDINAAFFEPNFNNTYFSQLAERFDWKYEKDELDFNAEVVSLPIDTRGGSFELKLSWGHGEIILRNTGEIEGYQKKLFDILFQGLVPLALSNELVANSYLLNLFALYQYYRVWHLEKIMKTFGEVRSLRDFVYFTQNLDDSSVKIEVIESIIKFKDTALYDMCATLIMKLDVGADLFYLKELSGFEFEGEGQDQILAAIGTLYDEMLKRPIDENTYEVARGFLISGLYIDKAIEVVEKGLENNDADVVKGARRLLSQLTESVLTSEGWRVDSALKIARLGQKVANETKDFSLQIAVYDLWTKLVKRGKGVNEAFDLVKSGMQDPSMSLSASLLFQSILKALALQVERGLENNQVIDVVRIGIETDNNVQNFAVKMQTLDLLRKLVKKGQGADTAIEAAQKVLRSAPLQQDKIISSFAADYDLDFDDTLKGAALDLFGTLVEHGHQSAFGVSSEAVKQGRKSSKPYTSQMTKELEQKLKDKGIEIK